MNASTAGLLPAFSRKRRLLQHDHRVRGHRLRQPHVRPDHRATRPDCRRPAQDGRVRVDDHVIFQSRMPLRPPHQLPVRVLLEGQGPEGHPLVELHVGADLSRLADHHPGPVVDEEPLPDRRPRVDVDPRLRMGELGHHPRDVRHSKQQQLVGQPVDGDRLQARIAEDDLVVAPSRRVPRNAAATSLSRTSHPPAAPEELHGLALGQGLEVDVRASSHMSRAGRGRSARSACRAGHRRATRRSTRRCRCAGAVGGRTRGR